MQNVRTTAAIAILLGDGVGCLLMNRASVFLIGQRQRVFRRDVHGWVGLFLVYVDMWACANRWHFCPKGRGCASERTMQFARVMLPYRRQQRVDYVETLRIDTVHCAHHQSTTQPTNRLLVFAHAFAPRCCCSHAHANKHSHLHTRYTRALAHVRFARFTLDAQMFV